MPRPAPDDDVSPRVQQTSLGIQDRLVVVEAVQVEGHRGLAQGVNEKARLSPDCRGVIHTTAAARPHITEIILDWVATSLASAAAASIQGCLLAP